MALIIDNQKQGNSSVDASSILGESTMIESPTVSAFEKLRQKAQAVEETKVSAFDTLRQKEGTVVSPKKVGLIQGVVQEIADPFLKTIETGSRQQDVQLSVLRTGLAMFMDDKEEIEKQSKVASEYTTKDYGYFGDVTPLGSKETLWENVKESVGTGMEIYSWFMPVPAKGTPIERQVISWFSRGFNSSAGDALGDGETVPEATKKGIEAGIINVIINSALSKAKDWARTIKVEKIETATKREQQYDRFLRGEPMSDYERTLQTKKMLVETDNLYSPSARLRNFLGDIHPVLDKLIGKVSGGLDTIESVAGKIDKTIGASAKFASIVSVLSGANPLTGSYWGAKIISDVLIGIKKSGALQSIYNKLSIEMPKLVEKIPATSSSELYQTLFTRIINTLVDEALSPMLEDLQNTETKQ